MRRFHLPAALLLAACAGAPTGATTVEDVRNPPPDGGALEAVETPSPGCPSTYLAATSVDGCAHRLSCPYADGACVCTQSAYCSGVAPGPDYRPSFEWRCTPAVRPDGCPGSPPTAGEPCAHDGTCSYEPDCCGTGTDATCASGQWAIENRNVACPP